MAIYVGMTNSAVNKILPFIKREISRPSQEILRELHLLLSSDSSYQNYRASLGAATGSCIPIMYYYSLLNVLNVHQWYFAERHHIF